MLISKLMTFWINSQDFEIQLHKVPYVQLCQILNHGRCSKVDSPSLNNSVRFQSLNQSRSHSLPRLNHRSQTNLDQ